MPMECIMTDLYTKVVGQGTPVVLVHGSGTSSDVWVKQLPLSEHFRLIMPDRRGYGRSPPCARIDYETDAVDIADLLGEGAHLVGESYGAVSALFAAGLRPEAVLSLVVIEPPIFGIIRGNPVADGFATRLSRVYATMRNAEPEEFVAAFNEAVEFEFLPSSLDRESRKAVRMIMKERTPFDAQVPFERLASAPFPKLVVSGGWNETFEAICNELARRLGAERAVVEGAGHDVIYAGSLLNNRLADFWEHGGKKLKCHRSRASPRKSP
jgi:pimeloyl-ACP methyl ester carboxylesterase